MIVSGIIASLGDNLLCRELKKQPQKREREREIGFHVWGDKWVSNRYLKMIYKQKKTHIKTS